MLRNERFRSEYDTKGKGESNCHLKKSCFSHKHLPNAPMCARRILWSGDFRKHRQTFL